MDKSKKKEMTIHQKILLDLKDIQNPKLLSCAPRFSGRDQMLEFISILKRNVLEPEGNRQEVLQFAGTLSNEEANQMQREISETFSRIEGEW